MRNAEIACVRFLRLSALTAASVEMTEEERGYSDRDDGKRSGGTSVEMTGRGRDTPVGMTGRGEGRSDRMTRDGMSTGVRSGRTQCFSDSKTGAVRKPIGSASGRDRIKKGGRASPFHFYMRLACFCSALSSFLRCLSYSFCSLTISFSVMLG